MEARDASSGGCKSHLELPKFSDNLEFQKSIDVDRTIADEDLLEQHSSGRYEEMDTELEIGVEDGARVSKEIEDIHFLEVTVTPLQKTEEMEIFMPLPQNGKSTEVKKGRELEQEKLKGTELLPPARENAQLKELVVSLPTPVYCNFASKWLLECDHKPKVKMKCRVDCVEFYSKFSHHCNSVSLGLLWRCASKLEASISLVTSIFSQDYFSEIFDTGSSRLGMDHIDGLIQQHYSVVEEEQHCSASSLDLSRRRFEVSDVIKPMFLNKKLWLRRLNEDKGEDSLMSIVYLFDRCEVVIRHDPFEVFVRGRGENGNEVLSSEGLFEFEQVREGEQTAWNGKFSSMMLMLLVDGEFTSMILMLLVDQKRNDALWMSEVNVIKTCQFSGIGWRVSIWFPKPRVKMKLGKIKHEKLVRIP